MVDFYAQLVSLGVKVVFTIISIIITTLVVPWIKNTAIPWLKDKHLYTTVVRFVQAAEKMAESEQIEKCDKKAFVIRLLQRKGIVIDPIVDAFIESAVEELDKLSVATEHVDLCVSDEAAAD